MQARPPSTSRVTFSGLRPGRRTRDPPLLAQWPEQSALNRRVRGSNPWRRTTRERCLWPCLGHDLAGDAGQALLRVAPAVPLSCTRAHRVDSGPFTSPCQGPVRRADQRGGSNWTRASPSRSDVVGGRYLHRPRSGSRPSSSHGAACRQVLAIGCPPCTRHSNLPRGHTPRQRNVPCTRT